MEITERRAGKILLEFFGRNWKKFTGSFWNNLEKIVSKILEIIGKNWLEESGRSWKNLLEKSGKT